MNEFLMASNILHSHFNSVNDIELWYNNYAWSTGFGVKKDNMWHENSLDESQFVGRYVISNGLEIKQYSQNCNKVRELRLMTRTGVWHHWRWIMITLLVSTVSNNSGLNIAVFWLLLRKPISFFPTSNQWYRPCTS